MRFANPNQAYFFAAIPCTREHYGVTSVMGGQRRTIRINTTSLSGPPDYAQPLLILAKAAESPCQ
jgi:hypothetical protein